MGKIKLVSSLEAAQHGPKGLLGFLDMVQKAGAPGGQPSNFMLDGLTVAEIKEAFESRGLKNHGISCHCPTWVLLAAWTGTVGIKQFLPTDVRDMSLDKIEQWTEDYLLALMDKAVELGVYVMPMFWGPAFGLEVASGYPWGMWSGPGYDLIQEGLDRFVAKTAKIRARANELGIVLAHEIHPGTAACCASDFLKLVEVCEGDESLGVNADPSHCWEGEDMYTRFTMVGPYVYGCHVKNHVIIPGLPLRSMDPDWKNRGMQFTDLKTGGINLRRYIDLMVKIGYPYRYCEIMGTDEAPLVVEAESAFTDGDETSNTGIEYVKNELCYTIASGSFEDGMGAGD